MGLLGWWTPGKAGCGKGNCVMNRSRRRHVRRRPLGQAALALLVILVVLTLSISGAASAAATPSGSGLRLELNLPAFALRVIRNGQVISSMQAGIGNPRTPTPVCSAYIMSRSVNPTWRPTDGRPPVPPGPANPLGKYWLALSRRNYGLHGTNNPSSIGKAISGGCVRFGDADIEYLYKLATIGTRVDIIYRRVEVVSWFGRPVALVHPDVYSRDPLTAATLAVRLTELGFIPLPTEAECAALLVSAKAATAWWPADTATFPGGFAGPGAQAPYGLLFFGGGNLGGPLAPGQAEIVLRGAASEPGSGSGSVSTPAAVRGWLQDGDLWVPAEWLAAALGRQVHISARYGWAFFVWPEMCMDVPAPAREIGGVFHVPVAEVASMFLCRVVTGATGWELWVSP